MDPQTCFPQNHILAHLDRLGSRLQVNQYRGIVFARPGGFSSAQTNGNSVSSSMATVGSPGGEVYNLHSSSHGTIRDRIMGGASLSRSSCAKLHEIKAISEPIFARRSLPNSRTGQSSRYRNSYLEAHQLALTGTTEWVLVPVTPTMVTSHPDRGATFCVTTNVWPLCLP